MVGSEEVKCCASCGYLGRTSGGEPWPGPPWLDASAEERKQGFTTTYKHYREANLRPYDYRAVIACYRGVDLYAEQGNVTSPDKSLAFIQKDRSGCPFYYRLKAPYWTAEQHLRSEDAAMLEQERLANALKIAELEQRSRESVQAALDAQTKITTSLEQVSKDHLEYAKNAGTVSGRFQIAFLILAFVACLQVLTLAYPNGIEWLVEHASGQPVPVVSTATPPPLVLSTSGAQP